MRNRLLIAIATIALLGAAVGVAFALFQHTVSRPGNDFSVAGVGEFTVDPPGVILSMANMEPGDVVYSPTPVTITNTSGNPLTIDFYSLATNADGKNLRQQLVLEVRSHSFSPIPCDAANFESWESLVVAPSILGGDPEVLIKSAFAVQPSVTGLPYCFRVTLPADTDGSYAGSATEGTFIFKSR